MIDADTPSRLVATPGRLPDTVAKPGSVGLAKGTAFDWPPDVRADGVVSDAR